MALEPLVPEIFGWKSVGYWQMLGLLALVHLFFGHAGRGVHHLHRPHHHLHETTHGLSREERREFIRRRMRSLYAEHSAENRADDAREE